MESKSPVSARSWNDPPHLGYSQIDKDIKRNVLKRRVQFPLGSGFENTNDQNVATGNEGLDNSKNAPGIAPPVSCSGVVENSSNSSIHPPNGEADLLLNVTDCDKLNFIIDTLEKLLNGNSEMCEKKHSINQRINMMKNAWDKISEQVKNRMYNLAQELSKGNSEAALKVHCILMVENVREVKQWMVGVKHIIEMERKNHIQNEHC